MDTEKQVKNRIIYMFLIYFLFIIYVSVTVIFVF